MTPGGLRRPIACIKIIAENVIGQTAPGVQVLSAGREAEDLGISADFPHVVAVVNKINRIRLNIHDLPRVDPGNGLARFHTSQPVDSTCYSKKDSVDVLDIVTWPCCVGHIVLEELSLRRLGK